MEQDIIVLKISNNMKRKNGFTLIELLVVSTVIAVLMAIGIVSYTSVNQRSRNTKRKSDVEQIRSALEMYRADNGSYPAPGASGDATTVLSVLVTDSYMAKIPTDPKSVEYYYDKQGCSGTPEVCYGYYVETTLEGYASGSFPPENTCTPSGSYNYCMKNP